jgi:hypothetical protein
LSTTLKRNSASPFEPAQFVPNKKTAISEVRIKQIASQLTQAKCPEFNETMNLIIKTARNVQVK